MSFNRRTFNEKRRFMKTVGTWMVLLSIPLFIIDWSMPIPTPVRGGATAWWILIAMAGAVLYYLGTKYPVDEVLFVADEYKGELTPFVLMQAMGVDQETAKALLDIHVKKGNAEVMKGLKDENVWRFPELHVQRAYEDVLEYGQSKGSASPSELVSRFSMSIEEAEAALRSLQERGLCSPPEGEKKRWKFDLA